MERLTMYLNQNPSLPRANGLKTQNIPSGPSVTNYRLTTTVVVPVVVHIILPNPYMVTDADVQSQINALNIDFSGLNPDSSNGGTFMGLRGHGQIQFTLARRTPGGQLTNGIERRAGNTASNINLAVDPIKRTSLGGLDVWDPNSYLNLWVGSDASGLGILGYAQFPGAGPAADDGVFLNYQSFGTSSCYTIPVFNRGRTGTHEVGHYFGLYHIWGDESGCTGDDFRQLPGGSFTLPAGLFNPTGQGNTPSDIGDTPNQAGATTSCPGGVSTDACATMSPGKMYQNYMDYTDDACYSMFTIKQVQRMEWVLDSCRAGLKISAGATPPAGSILLDAAPQASVNPGGFEFVGCNAVNYPSTINCGNSFIPKFRIVNNGLTTLTSVTVGYILDNGAPVTQTQSVSLTVGSTAVVSFPGISIGGTGTHQFRFFTSGPNASSDQVPANDTLIQNFTIAASLSLPVVEGFENSTFPPAGWNINNPDGAITWVRDSIDTPASGIAMAGINWRNYSSRPQVDELLTPTFNGAGSTQPVLLSFARSYRQYGSSALDMDTLEILLSSDCGSTYTSIWKKWGPALATVTPGTTSSFSPSAVNQWLTETIDVSSYASASMIMKFKGTNRFGNNLYLDNVNIYIQPARDLVLTSINTPGSNYCSTSLAPDVTVTNSGLETLTGFAISYSINGGAPVVTSFSSQNLAPGASLTVPLTSAPVSSGNNSIQICIVPFSVTSASGTGDLMASNNCSSQAFTVVRLSNPPVIEGFERSFPPNGWTVINPNNNNTWEKKTPGRNSSYSVFIDNFNFSAKGQTDDIRTPFLNVSGSDSLIISFDLAHKNFPSDTLADTLTVLASTDCGNSFTSVYKKWGASLSTAGSSADDYTLPVSGDWRNERLSLNNAFTSGGSVMLLFRNTNGFGNNIFIDNINIAGLYKRDLHLASANPPGILVCGGSFTPSVTIRNTGAETVTAFKLSYSIDNGSIQTTTVTGINLSRESQMTVNLSAATVTAPGSHSFKVYSWEPVSSTGMGDQYTFNDTLTKNFSLATNVQDSLIQNFTDATMPPAGWTIVNPDEAITWSRYATGNGNAGSAYVNTYNYAVFGEKDDLVSPNINFSGVDSIKLTFDLAAATYSYPGSTTIGLDTLEILASKDCGNTFTTVYKKWGEDLQTINDPNNPQVNEFFPTQNNWRRETIDLTPLGANGPVMLFFRTITNYENNIFIDNINLSTRTLPVKLKQQGHLILPTPFRNRFGVWHYQTPATLKYISVYNSAGQLVWTKQFGGNAQKMEMVDLTGKAGGLYIVKLGYEDESRNVSERVVKY